MVEVRAQLQRTSFIAGASVSTRRPAREHTANQNEGTDGDSGRLLSMFMPHGPEVLDLHDMGFSPCR